MNDTPTKTPIIEQLAHKLTVARQSLVNVTGERDNALHQIRLWTEKADKAGERVAMLETRIGTLRRMIADEASR
jgi:hypothetical protein